MKYTSVLSLLLLAQAPQACLKAKPKADVKAIHIDDCGDGERCIYAEAKRYEAPNYRVATQKSLQIRSQGIDVTTVDMVHIGPKKYYERLSDIIRSGLVRNRRGNVTLEILGQKFEKKGVILPPVQILEGIVCKYSFNIANFEKLKLPVSDRAIDTKAAYDDYKSKLYAANGIQGDDSNVSHLLTNKSCDEMKLSYNSIIPDLNASGLDFQKQSESRWRTDLERGLRGLDITRTNALDMIASPGDVTLDRIPKKAKNLAQFIFLNFAIGQAEGVSEDQQTTAYAFGSYFNASAEGIRNQAALDEIYKLNKDMGLNNFILPWGANHNPHFGKSLQERGFKLKKTEKFLFARCSDFKAPAADKPASDHTASEQMYASFCGSDPASEDSPKTIEEKVSEESVTKSNQTGINKDCKDYKGGFGSTFSYQGQQVRKINENWSENHSPEFYCLAK